MAWIGLVAAWTAAALWLGAANVQLLLASGGSKSFAQIDDEGGFSVALMGSRRRLCRIVMGAAFVMLASISVNVTAQGGATLTQGIGSVIALIVLLSLMFHVERAEPLVRLIRRQGAKDILGFILGAVAFMLATTDLVAGSGGIYPVVSRWVVFLGCGTLVGTILASIALVPLLRNFTAINVNQASASFFSRWTLLLGGLMCILACAGIDMVLKAWHPVAPLRAISIGVFVAPVFLVVATWGTCRQLKRILAEAPILGDGERTLQARQKHLGRIIRRVVHIGYTSAIASLLVAVGLIGAVMPLPRSVQRSPVMAVSAQSTISPLTPTITPAASANGLTLTQSANGTNISLESGPLVTGYDVVHLFLAHDQGQPITHGIVTLVISPMLVSAGSATIQAAADPAGKPGSFVATLNFTQSGIWQIVVLVATADQSIMASVVFSVMIR